MTAEFRTGLVPNRKGVASTDSLPQPEDLPGSQGKDKPRPDLLDRTGYRGENVVGARSDQSDGTYHYSEDNSQHHRVFCDILTLFLP